MASVLKKYQKVDAAPVPSPPAATAEKQAPVATPPAAAKIPVEIKAAEEPSAPAELPPLEPEQSESIAQTNSSSDDLMTNSADKQEVDNDTNESSNLEK